MFEADYRIVFDSTFRVEARASDETWLPVDEYATFEEAVARLRALNGKPLILAIDTAD